MQEILLTIGVFIVIITTGLTILLKYRKTKKIDLTKNQANFLQELFSALFHSNGERTALTILKNKYANDEFKPNLEENLKLLKPLLDDERNDFKKEDFKDMK